MFEQEKLAGSWRRWAGRVASGAQVALVVGVLVGGGLWAVSMAGTAPEAAPGAVQGAQPADLSGIQGYAWRTVYIVGSEDEAVALRHALQEGNNIREQLGLSYLIDEVVVAGEATEALRTERALAEGNLILAAFGVGDLVINLVA